MIDPIAELRPFETEQRQSLDLAHPPSAETGRGADPWALVSVPSGYVGVLRGRSAVVLLDGDLREVSRLPAPRSTTGIARGPHGEIYVVGELSPNIARYAVDGGKLVAAGATVVPGVWGLRDIAVTPAGAIWVTDEHAGELLRVANGAVVERHRIGHGPARVIAVGEQIVASAVLEHTIVVFPGGAKITNDGPFWGFDASPTKEGLVVVSGGAENHPLDRTAGYFGFIDSFVYLDRIDRKGAVTRLAAVNVSERGIVTPKAVTVTPSAGGFELFVTGYASAKAIALTLDASGAITKETPKTLVPGLRAHAGSAFANPLLDAWVTGDGNVVPVPDDAPHDARAKIGEALFFTSLMAPHNISEGSHSRFTCETCHFEGYTDGRTHRTGRGDVEATTKPLVGLAGNRPYFTRALDPDLSTVSHSEFRVAGAGITDDPYFDVAPADAAWLGLEKTVSALDLRRDLLTFLMTNSHRPNPATVGRKSFTDDERHGAELFRDRCASCHAARLDASDAATEEAFASWESQIFDERSPIVWASVGYHKTGITPYVHDEGARTTSLRRLDKKYPYFTNGSAKSIDEVLNRVRVAPDGTLFHDAPNGTPLPPDTQHQLAAFLTLL